MLSRNKDRGARNSGEAAPVEAAPVEAAPVEAAPAEGELQAYSEGEQYVDPAAAPAAAPAEVAQPVEAEPVTLQLPNTGTGFESGMPLAAVWAGSRPDVWGDEFVAKIGPLEARRFPMFIPEQPSPNPSEDPDHNPSPCAQGEGFLACAMFGMASPSEFRAQEGLDTFSGLS